MERIRFSENEIISGASVGKFQDLIKPPVTPKENLLATVRGETPCWLAGAEKIGFNPNIIPDNIARGVVHEVEIPPYKGGPDMFGVEWVYVDMVGGATVRPGNPILQNANDWREVIHFPDIDSWDWAGAAARNKEYLGDGTIPVTMDHFTGLYERLISFMDFENAAVALIDEDQQDAVTELFTALTDLHIALIDREVDYYHPTTIYFLDDWGSQKTTFFSRSTYEKMIFPHFRRIVDHAHKRGLIFELHSCGHSDSITDMIATLGIDMWKPQTMNDLEKMYQVIQGRFCLGLTTPAFSPDASEEEIEQTIRAMLDKFNVPGWNIYMGPAGRTGNAVRAIYRTERKFCDAQAALK